MHRTTRMIVALGSSAVMSTALLSSTAAADAATTANASTTASAMTTSPPTAARQVVVDHPGLRAFQRAVAPSDCTTGPLDAYFVGLAAAVSDQQRAFIVEHLDTLFLVPTYASLFLSTPGDPDYALEEQGPQLRTSFRDLRRFWSDVRSDDIEVVGMHGDVLLDADRIADSLTVMVRLGAIPAMTSSQIAIEARAVADFMAAQGDLYQSPLWTFGAFSFTGDLFTDPWLASLPDKIVMGDGTLTAYEDLGLGDVGPEMVMAHEFAHQVQFELGTYDSGPTDAAEATRRTELMADAMAVYYGVSKKGLALNSKRVVNALLTFYNVGDCSFDDPIHHGTPLQRQRAAAWGADLAAAARPRSLVLPSETVAGRFDEALPNIAAVG
jgi:hypothetical protein